MRASGIVELLVAMDLPRSGHAVDSICLAGVRLSIASARSDRGGSADLPRAAAAFRVRAASFRYWAGKRQNSPISQVKHLFVDRRKSFLQELIAFFLVSLYLYCR